MHNSNLIVAAFATAIACGPSASSPNIVGTWKATLGTTDFTITFNADGTFTQSSVGTNPTPQYPQCRAEGTTTGTYSVNGNFLTVMIPAYSAQLSNCDPRVTSVPIDAQTQTSEFRVTETTLTLYAPADSGIADAGAVDGGSNNMVVLIRQ